jgi:hypothetical protein
MVEQIDPFNYVELIYYTIWYITQYIKQYIY